jgi:hypothetical protein
MAAAVSVGWMVAEPVYWRTFRSFSVHHSVVVGGKPEIETEPKWSD